VSHSKRVTGVQGKVKKSFLMEKYGFPIGHKAPEKGALTAARRGLGKKGGDVGS